MAGQIIAAQAAGKMAENKATPYILGGVILVTVGIAYFGVLRPVLKKIGVLTGAEDKLEKDLLKEEAFDPNYGNPALITLTHEAAKKLATEAYDAINWYNDDEEAIFNVIQRAGSRHNLSLVARMFSYKYKQSLVEYISYPLDDEELKKVMIIINNFPK